MGKKTKNKTHRRRTIKCSKKAPKTIICRKNKFKQVTQTERDDGLNLKICNSCCSSTSAILDIYITTDPKLAVNLSHNVADHFNATVTPVCNSNIIHDSNSKASHVSNLHVTNSLLVFILML